MTRKGQISRERIIEAANRLIYIKGFNQTSFADVANEIGITKGNLHYHFKSKDEVLDAIVEYRLQGIRMLLSDWDNEFPDAKDRLHRFVQMLVNEEQELIRYGCPMGSLNVELGKTQLTQRDRSREMFDMFTNWLDNTFKQLGNKDHRKLSQHLLAMAQGAVLMSYVYSDADLLRNEITLIRKWIDDV
ncbi:MAG: TetR/AcrR family transcriptional regulator [Gammaproteobacteria bacterium]|nr:TetR/AcrR family transcriptional regulator [Gammaproteobacteria bacterium]